MYNIMKDIGKLIETFLYQELLLQELIMLVIILIL